MGLMYIFPVDIEDRERTELIIDPQTQKETIILKTYGLPMVFWSYLAAALIVIATMWLASKAAITKLLSYDDRTLVALGYLVHYTLILTPLVLLSFFFYEKHLKKTGNDITLIYKIFFIKFFSKKIVLDSNEALSVDHFMDSPNIAKIHNKEELRGFENKGYFELYAKSAGKNVFIDRHTRKADLIKIRNLLSKY